MRDDDEARTETGDVTSTGGLPGAGDTGHGRSRRRRSKDGEPRTGLAMRFRRHGDGLEFDRVSFFNDAVFAIALTIIVVGIDAPDLHDPSSPSELWAAMAKVYPSIYAFFFAFLIIGKYWIANHNFISELEWVDDSFIAWMMVYLACVAFLPFPATLMGDYPENPLAVSGFAGALGVVCLLETVHIGIAHRHRLYRVPLTAAGYRWTITGSLSPVVIFGLSIPLSFVNTYAAMLFWLASVPVGIVLDRTRPEQVRESGPGPSAAPDAGADELPVTDVP